MEQFKTGGDMKNNENMIYIAKYDIYYIIYKVTYYMMIKRLLNVLNILNVTL